MGIFSGLKKAANAVGSTVKAAGRSVDVFSSQSVVRAGLREADLSSSKSALGKALPEPVRMGVGIVGRAVGGAMSTGTLGLVKGVTYGLGKTGLAPLEKLDDKVGAVYRSPVVRNMRRNYATQLKIGAAVGGSMLASKLPGSSAVAGDPKGNAVPTAGAVAGDPRANTSTSAGPVAGDPGATMEWHAPSFEPVDLEQPVSLAPPSSSPLAELWRAIVAIFTPKP